MTEKTAESPSQVVNYRAKCTTEQNKSHDLSRDQQEETRKNDNNNSSYL